MLYPAELRAHNVYIISKPTPVCKDLFHDGGLVMNRFVRKMTEPLTQLYDEAHLDRDGRRSLNAMMMGNLFGNLNAIVCAGGTTAMVGLAGTLGATDSEFGLLVEGDRGDLTFQGTRYLGFVRK